MGRTTVTLCVLSLTVRKHRAPKGALRRLATAIFENLNSIVRKHRAPNGALRRGEVVFTRLQALGQKAPSAKRCIKTRTGRTDGARPSCQKPPSAKRCIKTLPRNMLRIWRLVCQKAPSAKRCIKTPSPVVCRGAHAVIRKHRAPKGAL